MKKFFKLIGLYLIVSLFLCNQEAHAYLNPGSGSYIFQVIIGGFLSIIYFFKRIIIGVWYKFAGKGTKSDE